MYQHALKGYSVTLPTGSLLSRVEALPKDAKRDAEVSRGLGDCMPGLGVRSMTEEQRLTLRGW